jgi:hypothetical protein
MIPKGRLKPTVRPSFYLRSSAKSADKIINPFAILAPSLRSLRY